MTLRRQLTLLDPVNRICLNLDTRVTVLPTFYLCSLKNRIAITEAMGLEASKFYLIAEVRTLRQKRRGKLQISLAILISLYYLLVTVQQNNV